MSFRAALEAAVVPRGEHGMGGGVDGDPVEVAVHPRDCASGVIAKALERLDRFEETVRVQRKPTVQIDFPRRHPLRQFMQVLIAVAGADPGGQFIEGQPGDALGGGEGVAVFNCGMGGRPADRAASLQATVLDQPQLVVSRTFARSSHRVGQIRMRPCRSRSSQS